MAKDVRDLRTDEQIIDGKTSFLIPFDELETYLEVFTDRQIAEMIRLFVKYEKTRELPVIDDVQVRLAVMMFKRFSDKNNELYISKSRTNSANAHARWDSYRKSKE